LGIAGVRWAFETPYLFDKANNNTIEQIKQATHQKKDSPTGKVVSEPFGAKERLSVLGLRALPKQPHTDRNL